MKKHITGTTYVQAHFSEQPSLWGMSPSCSFEELWPFKDFFIYMKVAFTTAEESHPL